jgi:hypothetical protein
MVSREKKRRFGEKMVHKRYPNVPQKQPVLTVMASYSPSVKLAKSEPVFLESKSVLYQSSDEQAFRRARVPDYAGPAADASEKRSTRLGQCMLGGIPLCEQSFFC